ncbi:hypothetical protein ACFPOG_12905 [Paenibacillus aestuarii]|uniref:Uncharacterized protein n=1 Tax=Paenibacillus aestuarii TaxID=516965 RepID=A0ABW0K7F3_9BACL
MHETLIILREETKFATVEKRCNGLTVGEKKVRVDDLLASLMDIMEPSELMDLVLRNEDAIENGLANFIEEKEVESVNRLFQLFLDRSSHDADPELLGAFFRTLTERFDMSQAEPRQVDALFKLLLERVNKLESSSDFNDLFLTLLNKVSITEAEGTFVTSVLQEVLRRANLETDKAIAESMFYELAKKADEKWVRQVLAPFISKERIVKSPILPRNCLMYQEDLDGTEFVVIEVEKQQFDVTYHKTSFNKVGHPKLLFEFGLRLNKVVLCRIYAVKDAAIKPTSKLFYYPFSNVFESFKACWPDLSTISVKDLSHLSTLPYLFFKSPSNDHAYRGTNLREFFMTLQGQDFNDDLLEDTGLTVGEQFQMHSRGFDS